MSFIDKKLEFFTRNIVVSIFIIGIISLLIRLYYFPYNIPITLDGLFYFQYAVDTSILGQFPTSYHLSNNGWPAFLSIFFSILHSNNVLDYMTVQRLVSVSVSVLTIIPVYLLCRRFVGKSLALFGAVLFAFEPRIIQNSLLGITEPLFILLSVTTLFFFLSENKRNVYVAFSIAALDTLVRYEGILLFVVISIMFFVRYKKESRLIGKYVLAASIFVLTLLPMVAIRIQTTGENGLTNELVHGATSFGVSPITHENNKSLSQFLNVMMGLGNLVKYLGWVMIPSFVFFAPIGAVLIFRNRNDSNVTIILSIIFLSLTALYSYSREIQETRYLYILYPMFCVLSVFTLNAFLNKFKNQHLISILLIAGILISSLVFLDLKKIDLEHEKEAFSIAKHVSDLTNVINGYYPESKYLRIPGMIDKFPLLSNFISKGPQAVSAEGFNSLEQFIKYYKKDGLTHIVVDGDKSRPSFLNDVFYEDEKYPYLTKVFDSSDYGYRYHVKVYKIDYDRFALVPSADLAR